MVQTHLGRLAGLAGAAVGVAADGRDPAGVRSELVRNILTIKEAIKTEVSPACTITVITFLSAGVGFSEGQ